MVWPQQRGCTWPSGGILVSKKVKSWLLGNSLEGLLWVELKISGDKKVAVGVVYVNPDGVRVQDMEGMLECLQAEA